MEPLHSEEEIEKCFSTLKDRRVSLRFGPRYIEDSAKSDRLMIDIDGPALIVDGWYVFGSDDASLHLSRKPGECLSRQSRDMGSLTFMRYQPDQRYLDSRT